MGKGSNVQKAQAARERNQKKMGTSVEDRKAATDKAKADSNAFVCKICRQTFMINVKMELLALHVTSKHAGKDNSECFDKLVGWDPNAPEPAAGTGRGSGAGTVKPNKTKKKKVDDLGDLLSAGLNVSKKKK